MIKGIVQYGWRCDCNLLQNNQDTLDPEIKIMYDKILRYRDDIYLIPYASLSYNYLYLYKVFNGELLIDKAIITTIIFKEVEEIIPMLNDLGILYRIRIAKSNFSHYILCFVSQDNIIEYRKNKISVILNDQ